MENTTKRKVYDEEKIIFNMERFQITLTKFRYERLDGKKICFRSSWEAKTAKYLDNQNIEWEYEHKTFDLGSSTYLPDF